MQEKHFYFLNDQYYKDFDVPNLMTNHEKINGNPHNRPCFYAFKDKLSGLFWMIPISSQIEKYRSVFENKKNKLGKCDTIVFGEVLGHTKAFLIQNMCPVTVDYISNEYLNGNNKPVMINNSLAREIVSKAKKILILQRIGKRIIFPDVLQIEKKLISKQTK